ncbi:unnamed protein product [Cylicocyclus nassatus]|uniref:Potassium channel domain-containing protein n=1 Tax=Cylicocyclus nassatus TaxID=53992 RepID=A0AA36DVU4_CYLNA|nr:unnamed protein product [Cylicocyclus nassatus]
MHTGFYAKALEARCKPPKVCHCGYQRCCFARIRLWAVSFSTRGWDKCDSSMEFIAEVLTQSLRHRKWSREEDGIESAASLQIVNCSSEPLNVIFISIATIGYGDFVPVPDSWFHTVSIMTFLSAGAIILTTLIDTFSYYLNYVHYIGRKFTGTKHVQIWFGGRMLTVQELIKI